MESKIFKKLKNLTILYAEDEVEMRENISDALSFYAREVFSAENGEEAFELFKEKKPDIIISDIHMPILDGIGFVKKVRQANKDVPIVMITAHTDKEYLLDAIDLHIEKYIVKPINLTILLETLKQCTNLVKNHNQIELEKDSNYKYDFETKELTYKDTKIVLNRKEILFFELLISNQDKIVTYEEIERKVWDEDFMTENAIRSLVRNLRKKLPTEILYNLSGVGYRFI